MFYDDIIFIPITGTPYESLTAEELNAMFPHYIDGMQSVQLQEIKSVGKNQIDITNPTESGIFYDHTTGARTVNAALSTNKIKIKPSATFVVSGDNTSSLRINYYTQHGIWISSILKTGGWQPFSATPPANVDYLQVSYYNTTTWLQIENDSTATPYEPYTESRAYTNQILRSIPNGTADEIDLQVGRMTKKCEEQLLIESDITAIDTITFTNIDIVAIATIPDSYISSSATTYTGKGIISGFVEKAFADNLNNTGSWYKSASDQKFKLCVPKGTYANLAAAQAALTGTKIVYQLETPETIQLNTPSLMAYNNGTIIIEPVVQEVCIYNNGITISNASLPVKSLKKVTKINYGTQGERQLTTIDLSQVTIINGTNITINGAADGDRYEIEYYYDSKLSTIPSISYSVPISQTGQINGNMEMIYRNNNLITEIFKQIKELMDILN